MKFIFLAAFSFVFLIGCGSGSDGSAQALPFIPDGVYKGSSCVDVSGVYKNIQFTVSGFDVRGELMIYNNNLCSGAPDGVDYTTNWTYTIEQEDGDVALVSHTEETSGAFNKWLVKLTDTGFVLRSGIDVTFDRSFSENSSDLTVYTKQ